MVRVFEYKHSPVTYGRCVSVDGTEYKPRGLQAVHKEVETTAKKTVSVSDLHQLVILI